jgi:biopolymer transport protein ExbD
MRFKRKTGVNDSIPVASMSDIAFLLIIFFMLSSFANLKKGPDIENPAAKNITSPPEKSRQFEITVDKNGLVFFENSYLTTEELTQIFLLRSQRFPDMYVKINADENTEYEFIDQVVKALQEANTYQLLFVCKKLRDEKT